MVLFALGSALMRAAGCAYNDIIDRDFDAKVSRTAGRPIPSGRISVKQALAFTLGCCFLSFLILISLPPIAIALGVGSLVLVAAYPFMKRITWWPQAWLGLTFNWGALLGFAAATGGLEAPALLLYASGIFWTLGYDTIYAVQDLEDDALAGVKSSARRLGHAAPKAVMGFYLIAIALAFASVLMARLGPLSLPLLALFALHLVRQARSVRIDDPVGALILFRSNRDAGFLLFAALMAGLWHFGV
jgi:4-hydroxybenzoate polyprenyltransferase